MTKNRLYLTFTIACLAAYLWLFYASSYDQLFPGFEMCVFKNATGIPCPSCGSTRAVLLLSKGDIVGAMLMNPIGILLGIILLTVPLWMLYDVLFQKETLLNFYRKTEQILKRKWIAIAVITLILANWIWNIYKNT